MNLDELKQIAGSADLDRTCSAVRDTAVTIAVYYRILIEQGFSRRQAFDLAVQLGDYCWQKAFWPNGTGHRE